MQVYPQVRFLRFLNSQETVAHEGISWKHESLVNSAGKGFHTEIVPKPAGISAGKLRISSSARTKTIGLKC